MERVNLAEKFNGQQRGHGFALAIERSTRSLIQLCGDKNFTAR